MRTVFYAHPACQEHSAGPGHPESPERLGAILAALEAAPFALLERREAPLAGIDQVALAHPREFVERVLEAVPAKGYVRIDADTVMSPASGEAALRAVGAVTAAVDAVMAGEARSAFCAVRPPGHHAEPSRPMGFCIFNNVAIGALHARARHNLTRVAVVDFDVHHGNGTQAMFERDGDLFFASTHQWPLYPGTGTHDERGVGNIVNCPLSPGAGGREFRAALTERILPALRQHKPDFILVSAGFDAHRDDPLASLELTEADYAWVTAELVHAAQELCDGRLVATLEGGYNLGALSRSVAAHVHTLMAS
ncbi:MAG: histone deacetylase family protein [Alphaproteobacteria bacterium]|nr:histone deacetylase family protein [Alphaproteobacteria bacterium]